MSELGFIKGYDFGEMEAMKYYAPPVSKTLEQRKADLKRKIFSEGWLGAEKKDGYFAKLVKDDDGNILLYSRSRNVNGQFVNKKDWVPQLINFFNALPNGTCLLGELYLPSKPGSKNVTTILGCLKEKAIDRQKKGEWLKFYVFDVLAYAGENFINEPLSERAQLLNHIFDMKPEYDFVEHATYLYSEDLYESLYEILAAGGEGLVIQSPAAKYEPGKRPSKTTLKVKKELQDTIDVTIIGANPPTELYKGKYIEQWKYWEDVVTGKKIEGDLYGEFSLGTRPLNPITKAYFNGWAGSLIIGAMRDGKMVPIGSLSGLTEEVLMNWRDYIDKVAEITAMQVFNDTYGLRHPKFVRWRDDLRPQDTDFYRIFGEVNE